MSDQQGPGRRLSPDEEKRGAEMYAGGASERDVADALGCSASTAHRLRERQAATQGGTAGAPGRGLELTPVLRAFGSDVVLTHPGLAEVDAAMEDAQSEMLAASAARQLEMSEAAEAAWRAELLEALQAQRAELSAVLATWQDRAQASRDAITALDTERLELIAAGRDPAPLRPRRRDAEDDLADSEAGVALAAGRLADTDERIAAVREEQRRADERADREAAAAAQRAAYDEGHALAPKAADLLREVVRGEAAAADLVAVATRIAACEQAGSGWRVDGVVLPPALPGTARDPWHWAVSDLWRAARRGDLTGCQAILPRCQPWADRDRAEFARMGRMGQGVTVAGQAVQPGPAPESPLPPPHIPHTVCLDENGRPIPPDDPEYRRSPFVPAKPRPDLGYWPR